MCERMRVYPKMGKVPRGEYGIASLRKRQVDWRGGGVIAFDMSDFSLSCFDLDSLGRGTLAEDLGAGDDITSMATIPADARFDGVMDSRDAINVAGLPIAEAFFRAPDPAMEIEILVSEGAPGEAGSDLMRLPGSSEASGGGKAGVSSCRYRWACEA